MDAVILGGFSRVNMPETNVSVLVCGGEEEGVRARLEVHVTHATLGDLGAVGLSELEIS